MPIIVPRTEPIRVSLTSLTGDGYVPCWDVRGVSIGTVQCATPYGAFGTGGTITLYQSMNGVTWVTFSVTFTASGVSSTLDLAPVAYLRPRLSTLGTGSPAGSAVLTLHAAGEA